MTPSESGELTSSAQRKNARADAKHLGKRRPFQRQKVGGYQPILTAVLENTLFFEPVVEEAAKTSLQDARHGLLVER
jgi:hypothetical protein